MTSVSLSRRSGVVKTGLRWFGRRVQNLSVFYKLLFSILLIVALVLVSSTVFTALTIMNDSLAQQLSALSNASHDARDTLRINLLEDALGRVRILAFNKYIQDRVAEMALDPLSIEEISQRVNFWAVGPKFDPIVQSILNGDVAQDLQEFLKESPQHQLLMITDPSGALVAASERVVGFYFAGEEWWRTAWNNGKGASYIGQPTWDENRHALMIQIAVPIFAHDAKTNLTGTRVVGILYATYKITSDLLNSLDNGVDSDAALGIDLYLSAQQYLVQSADGQWHMQSFPADTATLKVHGDTTATINGESYTLHSSPLQDVAVNRVISSLNWMVVARQSNAYIGQAVARPVHVAVLIGFIGLLFSFVMAYGLARLLTSPITALTRVVRSFSQGNNQERAIIPNKDELGVLATTFNQMADAIQQREADLNDLNHTLEQRVKERTTELRKANAIAMESIRLKSEFLSTMSHELRTPLNAIIGFTGIMLEGMGGEFDDDGQHMIERIQANGTRLLNLINDVLDLAKIEAGRMEVVNGAFSPADLAQQWYHQTTSLSKGKPIEFILKVSPDMPETLIGDASRVTQVAVNLLSNAFKFTDSGVISLRLSCTAKTWSFVVRDTGIGIAPHALNYIFEEFRQVDGSSKRTYGGSGLGLAICRNLCRIMGGQIGVTSELGKGSAFTVTLPLHLPNESEDDQPLETPQFELA